MADTGGHPPPNEFQTQLTSPKNNEQVGMEMYNGGLLPFKAYPKAWGGSHRHGSSERDVACRLTLTMMMMMMI